MSQTQKESKLPHEGEHFILHSVSFSTSKIYSHILYSRSETEQETTSE